LRRQFESTVEASIEKGFDAAMDEQRERGRASWKGGTKDAVGPGYARLAETFKTEKDFYSATKAKMPGSKQSLMRMAR